MKTKSNEKHEVAVILTFVGGLTTTQKLETISLLTDCEWFTSKIQFQTDGRCRLVRIDFEVHAASPEEAAQIMSDRCTHEDEKNPAVPLWKDTVCNWKCIAWPDWRAE